MATYGYCLYCGLHEQDGFVDQKRNFERDSHDANKVHMEKILKQFKLKKKTKTEDLLKFPWFITSLVNTLTCNPQTIGIPDYYECIYDIWG